MSTPRKEVLADGIELWLGDCREVLPTLGPIHALISDPPYGNSNHDGDWNARLNEHRGIESKPILNDGAVEMRDVVDAVLTQAVRLLPKEASACCLFCGGGGAASGFCVACGAHGPAGIGVLSLRHLGQAQPWSWATLSQAT